MVRLTKQPRWPQPVGPAALRRRGTPRGRQGGELLGEVPLGLLVAAPWPVGVSIVAGVVTSRAPGA